jgi:DHA1 family inner membrane transport protein
MGNGEVLEDIVARKSGGTPLPLFLIFAHPDNYRSSLFRTIQSRKANPLNKNNYRMQILDGALFMGGLQFIAAETVLPAMMKQLDGPGWVVSMSPIIMLLGFNLPVIFSVHAVSRMPRMKPFVIVTGVLQRIPFALAAICLFCFPRMTRLNLCLVALSPFLCGFIGGTSFGAWIRLLTQVIPRERRASVFAYRYLGSALIGMAAGGLVKLVLLHFPGTTGFALLHAAAFVFLSASLVAFTRIEEPPPAPVPTDRPAPSATSFLGSFVEMGAFLRSDGQLRLHLASRFFGCGFFILAPFLALHVLATLGKPSNYVGILLGVQMAGFIVGNLLLARLGDRHGGRRVLKLTALLFILVGVIAVSCRSEAAFLVMFFLYGAAVTGNGIGSLTMLTDIAPEGQQHAYTGIMTAFAIPGMLCAWMVSAVAAHQGDGILAASVLSMAFMAVSLVFLLTMKEPRHRHRRIVTPLGR